MKLSIIIPAHNSGQTIDECLSSVFADLPEGVEVIVVDDGSSDATASLAARYPCRILQLASCSGPSAARNLGAANAASTQLFFLDSDIIVPAGTWAAVLRIFEEEPAVSAFFGSYTATTPPDNVCSQFKNLLHHYTHQHSQVEAHTFCGGFGGIRKTALFEVGGFDEARFSLEDIELGYRLRNAGHRIRLVKSLQFTHLKRYSIRSLVRSDLVMRAIPWTELMLEYKAWQPDLNTRPAHIFSVFVSLLLLVLPALSAVWLRTPAFFVFAVVLLAVMNRGFLAFVMRSNGLAMAFWSYLLLVQMYLLCAIGACIGFARWRLGLTSESLETA